jgi:hypothetical protein
VRDVSVEFDLGNRQLIIHGVHVQCRVLGDRHWDLRGLLGRLLQEPYWCRGVHCMRGGEDACGAGCYDGEHVPDVRGGEVLDHGGKLWLRQLRSWEVLGDDRERRRVGLRVVHRWQILRQDRSQRRIDLPAVPLGDQLHGGQQLREQLPEHLCRGLHRAGRVMLSVPCGYVQGCQWIGSVCFVWGQRAQQRGQCRVCMQCGLRGISFRDMCYLPNWHVQSCSQQ